MQLQLQLQLHYGCDKVQFKSHGSRLNQAQRHIVIYSLIIQKTIFGADAWIVGRSSHQLPYRHQRQGGCVREVKHAIYIKSWNSANGRRNLAGPALAHLDSLLPALESLVGIRGSNLGLEHSLAFSVDVLEVLEGLPDTNSESGSNRSTESSGLTHRRSVNWNTNDIGLGLEEEELLAITGLQLEEKTGNLSRGG